MAALPPTSKNATTAYQGHLLHLNYVLGPAANHHMVLGTEQQARWRRGESTILLRKQEKEEQQEATMSPEVYDDDNDSESEKQWISWKMTSLCSSNTSGVSEWSTVIWLLLISGGCQKPLLTTQLVTANHSLIAQVRTSDASYAVSTATSTSSADSHCCKCCHQDNSQDNDESVLHPPAQQLLDAGIVRVPMPVGGWRLSRQSTS